MAREDSYKMFQLLGVLIQRYGYHQILIRQYAPFNDNERWLANPDNHYQLIRISFSSVSAFDYERERIDTYINYLTDFYHRDIRFLDIHIGNEEYDEADEAYDHLIIDLDHAQGVDVHEHLPEIYTALKEVDDRDKEIRRLNDLLVNVTRKRLSERKKVIPYVTCIIMAICAVMQILYVLLDANYSSGASLIVLGGDYKTFTVGLKQVYRLISCAFLHGSFSHLLANMYSLFFLGSYVESRYGKARYLFILFTSILVGSLAQDIISENTVTVGISGGLYGLMLVYISDMVTSRIAGISSFLPLIFVNLMINFISTTAWLAHLGGLLAAYITHKIIKEDNKALTALLVVMIAVLFIRLFTIDSITPLYGRTDMEIIEIYRDLGFEGYGSSLLKKLEAVYMQYGG